LNQTKLWAIQGSKLNKMKANSQYTSLFNTAKLYSQTQPIPGWPSLYLGPKPLVGSPVGLGKAASKSRPLKPG